MQRYKVRCHDCDPEIIPHEAGKWVKYSDVERLRAELAECKRDADRAEVERLRGVLVEVMEWTERYTAPGHPISTVIRAALAKGEQR